MLGAAESPALLALLLPSHGSLLQPAPPCPYPAAVAAFALPAYSALAPPPPASPLRGGSSRLDGSALPRDVAGMAWRAAQVRSKG